MGDSDGQDEDAQEAMALLGEVDLAPSALWALRLTPLPVYEAVMEMASLRNLTDGSDCNSDSATEGEFPGDGASAVESVEEEECDDFGRHMAFRQP